MLYAIHMLDRPGSAALRQASAAAHRAYVTEHQQRIALGGPLLAEDGQTMIGSLILLRCADRAEAEAFVAAEPYSRAGVFETVLIRPFRPVMTSGPLGPQSQPPSDPPSAPASGA